MEISVITPGKRFVALCNAFAHFFVDSYGKAELIATPINEVNFISWENYKRFITENPKYYQQTESRIISYWNEYYRRRFPTMLVE